MYLTIRKVFFPLQTMTMTQHIWFLSMSLTLKIPAHLTNMMYRVSFLHQGKIIPVLLDRFIFTVRKNKPVVPSSIIELGNIPKIREKGLICKICNGAWSKELNWNMKKKIYREFIQTLKIIRLFMCVHEKLYERKEYIWLKVRNSEPLFSSLTPFRTRDIINLNQTSEAEGFELTILTSSSVSRSCKWYFFPDISKVPVKNRSQHLFFLLLRILLGTFSSRNNAKWLTLSI